jgi:hypothetical protein
MVLLSHVQTDIKEGMSLPRGMLERGSEALSAASIAERCTLESRLYMRTHIGGYLIWQF